MNKSLKAKNLPLFSIIDLDQLCRENHLEGTEVTDFSRQGMEKSIFSWNSRPKHRVRTGSAPFHLYRSGNPAGLGGTAGAGNDAVSSWPLEVPVPLFAARR